MGQQSKLFLINKLFCITILSSIVRRLGFETGGLGFDSWARRTQHFQLIVIQCKNTFVSSLVFIDSMTLNGALDRCTLCSNPAIMMTINFTIKFLILNLFQIKNYVVAVWETTVLYNKCLIDRHSFPKRANFESDSKTVY